MTNRQEKLTDKHSVNVHVPMDLYVFLKARAGEHGLSLSAFMVWLLRREKRSTANNNGVVT